MKADEVPDRHLKPVAFPWNRAALIALSVYLATFPAFCASPCVQCHPKEVAVYSVSPMAHSLGPVQVEPTGSFAHAKSGSKFLATSTGSAMVQRVERSGSTEEYQANYAIGSGVHAVGYLIELRDHLFQSPFCYYPGRGWGLAPGYEDSNTPNFSRPVTPECLACHSGQARHKPASVNAYQDPPFESEGINCERCHGPVEAHLRNPVPGSIVNPANLPARARDSVCEQCHLNGESRIANPGMNISDFHAGQNLQDVFSVYVYDGSLNVSRPIPFKVISQSQELALSLCSRKSQGKLWCGTCHDPHQKPSDVIAYYRDRCLSCHGAALLKTHAKPNQDCIGCHMPTREVTDGAHTTFVDHRIARRPPPESVTEVPVEDRKLIAWHESPAEFSTRNLGLAEVEVGEKLKSKNLTLAGMNLLVSVWSKFEDDVAVISAIGEVLYNVGDYEHAVTAYEQAIKVEPEVPRNYIHAATALRAEHDDRKAADYLERALQLDPLQQEPYLDLGEIYSELGDGDMARRIRERYRQAFPGTVAAQMSAH